MAISKQLRKMRQKKRTYWAICWKIDFMPYQIYSSKKVAYEFWRVKKNKALVVKKVEIKVI